MTVKDHYDQHLADIYAWMCGDFEVACDIFLHFLTSQGIAPVQGGLAIDLGAAHGVQSVALARCGFKVLAVDQNLRLLDELRQRAEGLSIELLQEDIRHLERFAQAPELLLCCGDTLAHLCDQEEVTDFVGRMAQLLAPGGRLILSFRDYSTELRGPARFIPVRSDEDRILTCLLEYSDAFVQVTDLLHSRGADGWTQKASSYRKVRLSSAAVLDELGARGLTILLNRLVGGMTTLVAEKKKR